MALKSEKAVNKQAGHRICKQPFHSYPTEENPLELHILLLYSLCLSPIHAGFLAVKSEPGSVECTKLSSYSPQVIKLK